MPTNLHWAEPSKVAKPSDRPGVLTWLPAKKSELTWETAGFDWLHRQNRVFVRKRDDRVGGERKSPTRWSLHFGALNRSLLAREGLPGSVHVFDN